LNERKEAKRRSAFLGVILRTRGHLPRQAVREWSMSQYELLARGSRNLREIDDLAMTAWYLSAPAWMEAEAKTLWGRGWAQGKEVDG